MKHSHKKEKIKKSSFLYNIKTFENKAERNLNEGKWKRDKALFQEKENKGAFHQKLQNMRVSEREAHFRYMNTQTWIPRILHIYIAI